MIEAKIAQKGSGAAQHSTDPEKAELAALRSAVGVAKVNLKNARQAGLSAEQLAPYIEAFATAKATLIKRRQELKGTGPQL
jgi:hypothetical protein